MPRRRDSRKRLVQAALKLLGSRCYHETGIADILEESGCTRGVLYYHFSSKEELGYAALDELVRVFLEEGVASHLQADEHPVDRMLRVLEDLPATINVEPTGSPVLGLGVRMATVHEGFRQHLGRGLAALVQALEAMLRKGIADGQIVDSVDPREVAHVSLLLAHGVQMATLLGQEEIISEESRRWIRRYLNSLRA